MSRDPVTVALVLLRRRFPTVCLWFGHSTRHWWAYVDGRLVEACTPEELGRCIDLTGERCRQASRAMTAAGLRAGAVHGTPDG